MGREKIPKVLLDNQQETSLEDHLHFLNESILLDLKYSIHNNNDACYKELCDIQNEFTIFVKKLYKRDKKHE